MVLPNRTDDLGAVRCALRYLPRTRGGGRPGHEYRWSRYFPMRSVR